MKLWFDTEHRELVTDDQLRKQWEEWLLEVVAENGLPYVVENARDFSYETYAYGWCETLIPVYNAEHFKIEEVNPDDEIHQ